MDIALMSLFMRLTAVVMPFTGIGSQANFMSAVERF